MSRAYRHWNNMTWPVPGDRINEINWTFRHGEPTKEDLLVAASVLTAFSELVRMPEKRRNAIIRELRKGPAFSSETDAAKESDDYADNR